MEKPAELAAWALADKPELTLEKIQAAMQSGADTVSGVTTIKVSSPGGPDLADNERL